MGRRSPYVHVAKYLSTDFSVIHGCNIPWTLSDLLRILIVARSELSKVLFPMFILDPLKILHVNIVDVY